MRRLPGLVSLAFARPPPPATAVPTDRCPPRVAAPLTFGNFWPENGR